MDPTHKLANLSRGYDMNTFYPTAFHERWACQGHWCIVWSCKSHASCFHSKNWRLLGGIGSSGDAHFKLLPGENTFKGKQRASEKARDSYSTKEPGPPESWLFDIVRGSILFENADQIFDFLNLIRDDKSIAVLKSKNRFRNPTLSGYRDWNLQLRISTNDGSIKHICELQLHLQVIKGSSHYEIFRSYHSGETNYMEGWMMIVREWFAKAVRSTRHSWAMCFGTHWSTKRIIIS